MRQTWWGICIVALLCWHHGARAQDSLESLSAGKWQESWDRNEVCSGVTPAFTISVDRNKNTLTFNYEREVQAFDGRMRRSLKYFVREYRPHSLVLALDGETRKGENGVLVEWELIFVGRGIYRWRATEWPHREVNRIIGVRCSPDATQRPGAQAGK